MMLAVWGSSVCNNLEVPMFLYKKPYWQADNAPQTHQHSNSFLSLNQNILL